MLEPQLTFFDNRYLMTIRAEDGYGYVSSSTDGLNWSEAISWKWDNGEPLAMSTTQQHWLPHSDGLFLAYTRKAEENANVMRWRAPLYLAQVDRATLRLIRASEIPVTLYDQIEIRISLVHQRPIACAHADA